MHNLLAYVKYPLSSLGTSNDVGDSVAVYEKSGRCISIVVLRPRASSGLLQNNTNQTDWRASSPELCTAMSQS